jgi:hypothetical protein
MLGTNKQLRGNSPSVPSNNEEERNEEEHNRRVANCVRSLIAEKHAEKQNGNASTITSANTVSPIFASMNDSSHHPKHIVLHARHQQATRRQAAQAGLGAVQENHGCQW